MNDEENPPEPKSNLDWTPGEALRDMAAMADHMDADAGIAITVNRKDGKYETACRLSGMSISEAISLLEIQKHRFIHLMVGPRIDTGNNE